MALTQSLFVSDNPGPQRSLLVLISPVRSWRSFIGCLFGSYRDHSPNLMDTVVSCLWCDDAPYDNSSNFAEQYLSLGVDLISLVENLKFSHVDS